MWPFALLALTTLSFIGFAASMEMTTILGEDQADKESNRDGLNPEGYMVETLMNMSTVSSLTIEKYRYLTYKTALTNSEPKHIRNAVFQGALSGLSMFYSAVDQCAAALVGRMDPLSPP